MVTSKMYYIMSIKWTNRESDYALWWRPNCSGYTFNIDEAGIYPEAEVMSKPWYYNNGKETVALLCETARAISIMVIPKSPLLETEVAKAERVWPVKT